jgi:MFS family permease
MEGERFDKTSLDTSAARQEPDPRRWQALALLGSAFFMVILDATIVLTAVPSMQEDLRFSVSGVQSGMAAGLVDTSFNIGSALGIAIVTTVMVTRTEHVLAEGGADVDELAALTEGVQLAFLTTIAFAAIGFLAGVGFFRSRGSASQRDVDGGSEASA